MSEVELLLLLVFNGTGYRISTLTLLSRNNCANNKSMRQKTRRTETRQETCLDEMMTSWYAFRSRTSSYKEWREFNSAEIWFDLDASTNMYFSTKLIFAFVAIIHLCDFAKSDYVCDRSLKHLLCCRTPNLFEAFLHPGLQGEPWRKCEICKSEQDDDIYSSENALNMY